MAVQCRILAFSCFNVEVGEEEEKFSQKTKTLSSHQALQRATIIRFSQVEVE